MKELKVKRLYENATLPKRATEGSAGYDLFACINEPVTILPHETLKVSAGVAIELESNQYVALVYCRSGLATKNMISLINCVGVIDSDYRGELLIPLVNHSDIPYTINHGDRIAQLVISPVFTPTITEVDTLSDTIRGQGGFGSTDK